MIDNEFSYTVIRCSRIQTRLGSMDFSERKNHEYDFLHRGSKAVDPVSQIYGTQKNLKPKLEPLSKICRPFHAHVAAVVLQYKHSTADLLRYRLVIQIIQFSFQQFKRENKLTSMINYYISMIINLYTEVKIFLSPLLLLLSLGPGYRNA